MAQETIAPFSQRLLAWWDDHGRKDLPWQHPRTPYRVWISEIMLQQTQVTTVIPYFERWLKDFPDVPTLARASLDDVLSHWAGLGYYARARNLHKAAGICADRYAGELPATSDELASLPGIGVSTANAIVSQSSDQPAAVLDGNVRRVLARHAAIDGWTGKAAVQKQLWEKAEKRLPDDRGADYTQAIMDLGAMVCTRRNPGCSACPVNKDCLALIQDRVAELPTPKPSSRISEQVWELAVITNESDEMLMHRRPPAGIWGGLWCLPLLPDLELQASKGKPLHQMDHRLSHVAMTIKVYGFTAGPDNRVESRDDLQWIARQKLSSLGVPQPISKLLLQLETIDHHDP